MKTYEISFRKSMQFSVERSRDLLQVLRDTPELYDVADLEIKEVAQ